MRAFSPLIARLRAGHQEERLHVHFHQGPQGQPVPCFDTGCPIPRLSVRS